MKTLIRYSNFEQMTILSQDQCELEEHRLIVETIVCVKALSRFLNSCQNLPIYIYQLYCLISSIFIHNNSLIIT